MAKKHKARRHADDKPHRKPGGSTTFSASKEDEAAPAARFEFRDRSGKVHSFGPRTSGPGQTATRTAPPPRPSRAQEFEKKTAVADEAPFDYKGVVATPRQRAVLPDDPQIRRASANPGGAV